MASWFSYAEQPMHPSQPWDGSAMPSQAGKLAVVTGANSGIGFFTARALAARGAHVILACRSEMRGRAAEKEITAFLESETTSSGKHGKVEFMELELARLESVRAFVAALTTRGFKTLDLLVNNAGLACPAETITPDGFETQFQVNHLSHFYLTALLFPLLQSSPEARVVNVSSHAHRIVGSMEFETLAKGTDRSFVRYGRSKLANLMFTFELEKRIREAKIDNVKVVAAHPGLTYSDMGAKWVEGVFPPSTWGFFKWVLTVSPTQETEMGALPSLYAATVENVASGDFYGPANMVSCRGFPVKEVPQSTSRCEEDRVALWELSEQLTGKKFAFL